MSENKNKKVSNEETEKYEGEVVSPDELEDEETKESDSKEPKTKDGFFSRAGSAVKDTLDSISLWDVVKGVALFGGGIALGVVGTKYIESRHKDEDELPFSGDNPRITEDDVDID